MIYIFLANGFEEIEAITSIDVLRRAELKVQIVGVGKDEIIGAHGVKITADIREKDICFKDIDAIVLPGGMPGTSNLENSDKVLEAIKYCNENKKYIAAICAAPSILGHMNLLDGKEFICFPGFENSAEYGILSEKSVCISDNIITAKGPGVSLEFALKIVECLCSKDISLNIEESMQCK